MYLRQAKLAINMAKWYHQDMLVKTTLRLKKELKKDAERLAVEQDISFQEFMSRALDDYINKEKGKQETNAVSDREFASLLKKVNQEYGPALRKLAKL